MFIELTNYEIGQKELVNTQWIEEIRDDKDCRIVYFAFCCNDEYGQEYLKVTEEYHEIKRLLRLGDRDAKIVEI